MIFACSLYGFVTRKDRNVTNVMILNWKEVLHAVEIGLFFSLQMIHNCNVKGLTWQNEG
jgi:hypothetical protein